MRKNVLFLLVLAFGVSAVKAQQDPQFTQNMFNHMAVNPGYAGIKQAICAKMFYRQQWLGFSETIDGEENDVDPQTMLLSLNGKVNPLHGGLGLVVYKDKLGYEDNIGVKFGYSFHLPINNGTLGIGVMAGFLNKKIDFSKFSPIDVDPLLASKQIEDDMVFDMSFGLFYDNPDKFYVGLSSNQLLQAKTEFATSNIISPKLKRHYYLTGGYNWQLNNPLFEIKPSLFVKSDFASTQLDVNALLYYNNQFWGGLSYRISDAVAILLGASPFINSSNESLQKLKIGYSYDVTTSAMGGSGRSSGSHEVFIGYCFNIVAKSLPESYRNVRFL